MTRNGIMGIGSLVVERVPMHNYDDLASHEGEITS